MAPIVDEVAQNYASKGLKVGKVDVSVDPDLASTYGIFSVPTLLFFKGGQVRSQTGFMPKGKLTEKVEQFLAN